MNIFKKKVAPPVDKVKSLSERSASILSIFKSTVNQLDSVNTEIAREVATREQTIANLGLEIQQLSVTKTNNQKVVDKINNFLSE